MMTVSLLLRGAPTYDEKKLCRHCLGALQLLSFALFCSAQPVVCAILSYLGYNNYSAILFYFHITGSADSDAAFNASLSWKRENDQLYIVNLVELLSPTVRSSSF